MYDFHYNYIKKKYCKAKLLMTDTDSLTYHIETEDLYKQMLDDKEHFDCSDYPKNHYNFSEENKKVVGKFKDETNGVPIKEFVGLRSKMYKNTLDNGDYIQKAKGIKKMAVKGLEKNAYKKTLTEKKQMLSSFNSIRSYNHNLHSIEINKIGLSCYDDKRYILDDGVSTLAYGHYKTKR